MSYVSKQLTANEKVGYKTHKHWIIFFWPIIFTCLTAGALFFLLIPPFIVRITNELVITSKRVIGKTGLIAIKAMDSPLSKINNVKVSQSIMGSILNYGTIEVDTDSGTYLFKKMSNPAAFRMAVTKYIEINEENNMQKQAEKIASSLKEALSK